MARYRKHVEPLLEVTYYLGLDGYLDILNENERLLVEVYLEDKGYYRLFSIDQDVTEQYTYECVNKSLEKLFKYGSKDLEEILRATNLKGISKKKWNSAKKAYPKIGKKIYVTKEQVKEILEKQKPK